MPHLENWSLIRLELNAFTAPELHTRHLTGVVSGHPDPQIADGTKIVTSQVLAISEDLRTARTRNTRYTLEEVDRGLAACAAKSGMTVRAFVRRLGCD